MATIKKYNGSTWENTIARKYETKSEIIVPPTTIYTDGSNITTYTIKGNTVQDGTPTQGNPVPVVGVGELEITGEHTGEYKIPISSGGVTTNIYLGSTQTVRQIKKLVLTGEESGWVKNDSLVGSNAFYRTVSGYYRYSGLCTHYATVDSAKATEGIFFGSNINFLTALSDNIDTIDKWKTYLQQQYAAGTPVTVWYVLATPETAAVNEPLMKIGDYADTLSNVASIPTTEGANSITVDTTVQPSEFTATWIGWHDASVKEWDGSDWQ